MKIALIGYGKMGRLIHHLATIKGHSIVAVIHSKTSFSDTKTIELINEADICIDFSIPEVVLTNVKWIASLKTNIVMGTTGWHDDFEEIKQIVDASDIGFLHAPNFSLGIALFLKMVEQTAELITPFKQYDIAGIEMHHREKLDSPSGTAKAIENRLNSLRLNAPTKFSSVRAGYMPGTHSVIYDSQVDSITLTHTARSREGFAEGAITAAEWLEGKQGMFTLDDLMKGI